MYIVKTETLFIFGVFNISFRINNKIVMKCSRNVSGVKLICLPLQVLIPSLLSPDSNQELQIQHKYKIYCQLLSNLVWEFSRDLNSKAFEIYSRINSRDPVLLVNILEMNSSTKYLLERQRGPDELADKSLVLVN